MLPEIEIRLFGAPSLTRNGQVVDGFISNKGPALIYYLATVEHSQMREILATLLWTDTPELYAKKNLRNVLSNLRTLLEPLLDITRTTVTLKTEAVVQIDCIAFVNYLKAAEQAEPDSAQRGALLAKAMALYQGPLLDGFSVRDAAAFEEWLRNTREHFQRLALQALNELVAYSAHQGELLTGINYASRLLALDPLREETHRRLMLMLALDGQSSAALAQYRTCQQILRQELGVEPAPETKQLYARIQAGEFSGTPTTTFVVTLPRPRLALPAELTGFVDRVAEAAQVRQRLTDPACRLLTITGLGGVGKTRLALHVAHQWLAMGEQTPFRDGIGFVPLAALEPNDQSVHLLATTIAASLQLPLMGVTAPAAELIQALYDKDLLLILDSCEHLPMDALLSPLLQQTRQLKLLVTSRARLNILGEQLLHLTGLATPNLATIAQLSATNALRIQEYSAIQLFVQRVQAVLSDLVLDQATATTVAQICRLLHGLPLGIELAAAWAQLLPLAEIAQEIQQNLDFLENTAFATPANQRGLRAVFNHSWHLLSATEQQALRRLAVFRGGFTREAANKVAGATLPLLALLTDKSLVQRVNLVDTASSGATGAKVRYELQAVMRQYAAEQLADAGETARLQAQHAAYMAEFLAARQPELQSAKQQEALDAIHAEIENIRAAWQWLLDHLQTAQADLAQIEQQVSQIFDSLFFFYDMRSWFQEGETVFRQLADQLPAYAPGRFPPKPPMVADQQIPALWRLQAKAQARQGWFAFHLGRASESRHLLEQSLANLEQLGAEAESVFNLNYLGAILRHTGEFAGAERYLKMGLAMAQAHGDRLGMSIALNILGQVAYLQGDYTQSQNFCQQALAIKQASGERWGMTYSLTYLGRVAQATGDYQAAQKLFDESLAICQALGDQRGAASALRNLADTAQLSGQIAVAQARYAESLQIYRRIGSRAEASLTLTQLGEVACASGAYALAADYLQEALALAWSLSATLGLLAAVLGLAGLALASGQPEQAEQPLQLVYHHPAASQVQKTRAEQLLTKLGVTPMPSAPGLTLDTYVQARLAENAP